MTDPHKLQREILGFLNMGFYEEAKALEKQARLTNPEYWRDLNTNCETEHWLSKFITADPEMILLKEDIKKCTRVDDPILIRGETGTGKELLAQALHGGREGNFIAVNVTNLPSELLESELFGSVRGAFTGAVEKAGLFQYANKGTIFLDEIGDMPFDMQAKLLRALQDKKARRLGSNEEYKITARVISATNSTLNRFRDDLYHRLSVIELWTKPLRARKDDVQLIVNSLEKNFPSQFEWTDELLSGNVRSIQKIIKRWQILGRTT